MESKLYNTIHAARQGDVEAFNELVGLYKGKVFRHAYSMVHNQTEADDISQEAFIKAYYSLQKLSHEEAFVSWLSRIVHNACINHIKKNKRETAKQQKIIANVPFTKRTTNFAETMNNKLLFQEAMKNLSIKHRSVIVLCDVQGFSYEEISDILEVPVGTVKSRINSARKTLKTELQRGEENG